MKNKKRDINAELAQCLDDIKANRYGRKFEVNIPRNIKALRARLHLSQSAFAALLNINVRTLQGWEQGLKKPKGPAISLLTIAAKHPEIFTNSH